MVIAILALIAAVTGAAVAGSGTPITKKKAKKIVRTLAPKLSVKSAGSAGSLKMYAQVTKGGALTANSAGIGKVTHSIAGVYCLSGLAAAPKGGVATVDFNGGGDEWAQFGLGTFGGCPGGTQAFVVTIPNTTDTFTDAGFFVTIWS
jgi:hypothetical protein